MNKGAGRVTFHYMLVTGGFWMSFCVISSYAAVFLQGIGYNNLELGLIMALGNLGGTLLSTVIASRIDRNRKLRHATIVNVLLAVQLVQLAVLRISPVRGTAAFVCYVLYMAAIAPVNAVNLDLCVRLQHAKAGLNFGMARSMGSFAFVILSMLLGVLTVRFTYLMLPFAGMAVILLQYIGNVLVDRDLRRAESGLPAETAEIREPAAGLRSFIRENRSFCLMLVGTILIFTSHSIDGNFLINLVNNLGGDTAVMGYVGAFTAIVEIPVMMFSSRLPKSLPIAWYLRLSFVCFVLKILAYTLAPSIPLFFAARILQAPSYALYTVLIVPYADQAVARKDSAKAQSLAFSMTTIGMVLASLVGGKMFDACGVKTTLWTATAIAAAGAAIALAGVRDRAAEGNVKRN